MNPLDPENLKIVEENCEIKDIIKLLSSTNINTVLSTISTVMLDPENSNHAVVLRNITDVTVNGQNLGLGGYLDIGLFDTMKDLLVNFVGAVIFSVIGYFYVKRRGKGKFASHFIPSLAETEEPDES